MDEAAAKLRVALYSMPDNLKAMKNEIEKLASEEEQAGLSREYERAAQKKSERLRIDGEYKALRETWETEHHIDEVVDVNDIADVIAFLVSDAGRWVTRQNIAADGGIISR